MATTAPAAPHPRWGPPRSTLSSSAYVLIANQRRHHAEKRSMKRSGQSILPTVRGIRCWHRYHCGTGPVHRSACACLDRPGEGTVAAQPGVPALDFHITGSRTKPRRALERDQDRADHRRLPAFRRCDANPNDRSNELSPRHSDGRLGGDAQRIRTSPSTPRPPRRPSSCPDAPLTWTVIVTALKFA